MSQKTAALGLIFGILGMGLAGYMLVDSKILPMFDTPTGDSFNNMWFVDYGGTATTMPVGLAAGYLSPFSLEITVSSGEDMYGLFTGYINFATGAANVLLYVYVDGVYSSKYTRITRTDSSGIERYPFALQWIDDAISPGKYNVSMWGYVQTDSATLYSGGLLIQTF